MKNEVKMKKLSARIKAIKNEIGQLGEMRTGSLTMQYNVCGNPNCRCKDPENPRKHGPYYQLSYTRYGKSTSEFIRRDELENVKERLKNYQSFRKLKDEWIDISIQLAKLRKERNKK